MSRFVLKCIDAVKGRQSFKQLIIVDDDSDIEKIQYQIYATEQRNKLIDENKEKGEKVEVMPGILDLYENGLENKYASSYRGILMYMNLVADLQSVSSKKFKFITPSKEKIKEFEFKNGDLRVYGIDFFGCKLIMFCGHKNQQPQDIVRFRSLKKQFLEMYNTKYLENEKRRIN